MSKSNEVFEFEGQKYVKSERVSSDAKVGDVIHITLTDEFHDIENECMSRFFNRVLKVSEVRKFGVNTPEVGGYINFNYFEILEPAPKTNPRPHAELIKQWADDDSLEIEFREDICQPWEDTYQPAWIPGHQYRFKPKTVPAWQVLYEFDGDFDLTAGHYKTEEEFYNRVGNGEKFIQFILETEKQV